MIFLVKIFIFKLCFVAINQVDATSHAMDMNLYEEVLDPQACEAQMTYIINNDTLLKAKFMDASVRTPRGIMMANLKDMGNYYQCLNINQKVIDAKVEGKHCVIQIPLKQNVDIPYIGPEFPWSEQSWNEFHSTIPRTLDKSKFYVIKKYEQGKQSLGNILGNRKLNTREIQKMSLDEVHFELAICIPKVCTSHQALSVSTLNISSNFEIRELFCRLPNDKPWVAADYVAITIFSIIGLLTLLSTFYDVRSSILLEKDPKQVNKLYASFSAYSNAKKLFKFQNNSNVLTCLDGIRAISMLWIIILHTFATYTYNILVNPLEALDFIASFTSLWITSGTIAVDTFFMISGLLLVYTTASKFTRMALLKNLHLFYLNRLLRMFPVLATGVLLQASLLNHVTDGPYWGIVAKSVDDCRQYWWSTLLYVHNIFHYGYLCVGHSWYLAINMQLYIISPVVLFWILGGSKRSAWIALIGSLLMVITASTIYNFIMEFQFSTFSSARAEESGYYTKYYYINTLSRAAPFFVGMIFGYMLHIHRGRKVILAKVYVILLWALGFATTTTVIISHYFPIQPEWNNQTLDSILNSFMRPAWAAGVAMLVLACAHGYAGPINWFLSLNIFKILSRLSYAMYILHLPLMYITNGTSVAPVYFTVEFFFYKFMVDLNLTIIASVLVFILIDLPFSTLIGLLFSGSKKNKFIKNERIR